MDKLNIKKYRVDLKALFKSNPDKVDKVRDDNLQILNLGMNGSIVHTDKDRYDLYDGAGRLMFGDGEHVILITTERYSNGFVYVLTGYDGEGANTYKFTQEEFDVVAVLIDDIKQL